jgi:hypothetical protein
MAFKFPNIKFNADTGFKIGSGVLVLGILVMCVVTSIFGLQVFEDVCKVEDKSTDGTPGDCNTNPGSCDENATWKGMMFATEGIGWSPVVMIIIFVVLKIACAGKGSAMVWAGVLGVVMGGGALAASLMQKDASEMRELVGGAIGGIVTLFLTLGIKQPTNIQGWAIRMGIVGILFFGWMIVLNSASLAKYGECQKARGCNGTAVCDNTCSSPPSALPCGDCGECDEHDGIVGRLWAVNGTSIGMFVVSVAALVAAVMV